MALSKEHYSAFEAVVGPENISDDPVDLDAWAWRSGMFALAQDFKPRFEAILMPGSTEEVQAIVRLCNTFGVQFKASSTGWGVYCDAGGPGCIKLDMRRMNRIIEINEENMYAVVEPYVIHAQLQAELMKRGFCCNVNGAGGITSAMPLAAHEGIGHMSGTCSISERNQLALEWVTPEGEIIQTGSLAALGEWFCADGPGPSLRGVVRGNVMPLGGLGVYTKAALKIYHWGGPPTMEVEGNSPDYVAKIPATMMLRYLSWPDEDGRQAGMQKLGRERDRLRHHGLQPQHGGGEHRHQQRAGTRPRRPVSRRRSSAQASASSSSGTRLATSSTRRRCSSRSSKIPKAKSLEAVEEGDVHDSFVWRFIRVTASIRETMRATGVFGGEVFGTDSYRVQRNAVQHSRADKKDLIDGDLVYPDNVDPFITSLEQGQLTHAEVLLRWTPAPDVAAGALEYVGKANASTVNSCHGLPHHLFGDGGHDFFGPHSTNYTHWLRSIKKSFDPNGVSEASNHITAK